jgi:hypothetical protein
MKISGRRWPEGPSTRGAIDFRERSNSEDHRMDKKAKTPKKPKQTKTKDGRTAKTRPA